MRIQRPVLYAIAALVVLTGAFWVGKRAFERRPDAEPLIEVHRSFADRLRGGAPDPREIRDLSVKTPQRGETLLALSLSGNSAWLAVVTTHRVLCFSMADERWAEWNLPRTIGSAGALHVDDKSGRAHVIVGDDGQMLSANCRSPGSALMTAHSATDYHEAVAWIDPDDSRVWLAPVSPTGAKVRIIAQPLLGMKGKSSAMQVFFPGEPNAIFGEAAEIHSIAKLGDNLLLFYGDSRLRRDTDVRDESVLVVDIEEPDRQTNRLVFAAVTDEKNGGKKNWSTTRVRRLLPASSPGRVYALTEGPHGVSILGPNAKPIETHEDALFSTEYRDGKEFYDLSLKSTGNDAQMDVRQRTTGAWVRYALPWHFKFKPRLGTISSEGRRVVIANASGGILLIDLARSSASSPSEARRLSSLK